MESMVVLLLGICLMSGGNCLADRWIQSVLRLESPELVKTFEKEDKETKFKKLSGDFPFRNTSLSFNDRVDDLVGRLTLEELVQQLSFGGANVDGPAPAINRLGIGPHQWNNECLRGYVTSGDATCFPQPVGLAATFDPALIEQMARAVSWEARAKNQNFSRHGEYHDHTGLDCFSPVINIMRHPLWGRNQETYGEDPYLTGEFAKHFVWGLQGNNDRYEAATATCKHFDVHGGPENIPVSRFGFNAVVSDLDWQMTFLPAFRACVGAGAYGVMCSYNAVNGVPACANKKLLTDILRGELDFSGYVVSDENAIEDIDLLFNYTKTPLDTAIDILRGDFGFSGYVISDSGAVERIDLVFNYTRSPLATTIASINAGVNLELTGFGPLNRFFHLKEAVQKGMLTEDFLRERAKPLFYTRFKLGEFDPAYMNPYANVSLAVVQSQEHRELANTIASKSFVLLKNNGALPIRGQVKKATIVGPFAKNKDALTGDYAPGFDVKYFSSPYDGVQKLSSTPVELVQGCVGDKWDPDLPKCVEYDEDDVKNKVPGSELIVVTLGTGVGLEREGHDRADINLPGKQLDLLKSVVKYADKRAVIVVLLFNAGPLDVSFAKASADIDAMIACHYPAQSAGEAIFRVISGQENPAGRVANTWPQSLDQVPDITNYTMVERTYRYSTSEPLYPFGYGLSYTKFSYVLMHIGSATGNIGVCDPLAVSVTVNNTGTLYGEEVIQIYISWKGATVTTPNLQLVSFKRVGLGVGETVQLDFMINPERRAVWKDGFIVEPGDFNIYAGGQQPNQKTVAPSNVIARSFTVMGNSTTLASC